MITIWIFVLVVLGVFFLLKSRLKRPDRSDASWPYTHKVLMSPAEQSLYFRLVKALPEKVVLAQVQLSRFLAVRKGHPFVYWNNRISQKSADFVICNKGLSVEAVIELDDLTHQKENRRLADFNKNKALTDAGIRLVRWKTTSLPNEDMIRSFFDFKNSELEVATTQRK